MKYNIYLKSYTKRAFSLKIRMQGLEICCSHIKTYRKENDNNEKPTDKRELTSNTIWNILGENQVKNKSDMVFKR